MQNAKLVAGPAGYYEIRWTEGRRSKRVSTRTKNFQEATKFLAGFIHEQQRADAPESLTVSDAIRAYLEHHVERNAVAPERIVYATKPILAAFGDLTIADLDQPAVNAYVDARRRGKVGKPAGNSTIRYEIQMMVTALRFALRQRRQPDHVIPPLTLPPKAPPRDRWLTPVELERLLAASDTDRGRLTRCTRFLAIAIFTASRKAAILGLKWGQVDLEHGVIDFRIPGRRVTGKRRVPVPIADDLMPWLRRAYAERQTEYVLDHPGSIRASFRTACQRAGLGEVSPHVLRHSWATNAARSGRAMLEIAAVLGDDPRTVERNYIHHTPDFLRDAVNGAHRGAMRPNGASDLSDNGRQWPTMAT